MQGIWTIIYAHDVRQKGWRSLIILVNVFLGKKITFQIIFLHSSVDARLLNREVSMPPRVGVIWAVLWWLKEVPSLVISSDETWQGGVKVLPYNLDNVPEKLLCSIKKRPPGVISMYFNSSELPLKKKLKIIYIVSKIISKLQFQSHCGLFAGCSVGFSSSKIRQKLKRQTVWLKK